MTLYDLVVSLLGTPPDSTIMDLYYVLCVFLVIFMFKLMNLLLRAIFHINGR